MFKIDKPLRFIGLWFFVFLFIRFLGYFTSFADNLFPNFNFYISKIIVAISGWISISVGDILYTILGFSLLISFVKILVQIKQKKWYELRKMISYLFIGLTVFMTIFYVFWGFNYYKTPIKETYKVEQIHLEELKYLAEFYLEKSIETREYSAEDKNGVFNFQLTDNQLKNEIIKTSMMLKNIDELRLTKITQPNIKRSLYSKAFSYMGVLGYYNPFTSESQFNSNMPDTKNLFTKFHEVAHQWGFASESEANYVGFLIGIKSSNRSFNYVSNYKALRSILNKIVWEDPAYVESMLNCYSPQMKRDREYEIFIQKKYHHSADDAFSMLNEAYLQLNNQDGLESYGQFVELLVGYHRTYNLH